MTIVDQAGPFTAPVHLSYSQQNTLSDCGGRYFLEKIQRVPSRPGWANVGGTAVHRVTERIDLALMLENQYIDDPELIRQWYLEAFEQAIENEKARSGFEPAEFRVSGRASKEWPDKETPEWWLAKGPAQCLSWVRWRDASPWVIADFDVVDTGSGEVFTKPAVELEFEFTVDLNPGTVIPDLDEGVGYIRVIGSIDRVMKKRDPVTGEWMYYIVDLKSGSREPVGKAQLLTYRKGLLEAYGVDAQWAGFWMSRKAVSTLPVEVGAIDLNVVDYGYRKAHEQRMAVDFRYHESSLCNACGVNAYCPLFGGQYAPTIKQPWEVGEISLRRAGAQSDDGSTTENTEEQK